MFEVEEADYARSISKSGVVISVCVYCDYTMAARERAKLLLAELTHNCPEKQDAKANLPDPRP